MSEQHLKPKRDVIGEYQQKWAEQEKIIRLRKWHAKRGQPMHFSTTKKAASE